MLPGNVTVKLPDLPGAIEARFCGSGVPDADPSIAALRVTLVTAEAPVFVTVIASLYPPLWDPVTADVVVRETAGAVVTDSVPVT